METWINTIKESPIFTPLDLHFAQFMCQKSQSESETLFLGALLTSQQTAAKNACALLKNHAETEVIGEESDWVYPDYKTWIDSLKKARMVGVPGERKPLILTPEGQLYLFRYWQYETQLAKNIHKRLKYQPPVDLALLKTGIAEWFSPTEDTPWQKLSAISALLNGLSVITGGPGTGKTTTVTKILALLLAQNPDLKIQLAAPTGKAAARLKESIKDNIESHKHFPQSLAELIPKDAKTLHRLLGYKAQSVYFRHDASNPLDADVVIIDEASMIDLAMMAKLFDAVPVHARLILLGDKDQLASVEAGCVLGDICAATQEKVVSSDRLAAFESLTDQTFDFETSEHLLENAVLYLQKSYRFHDQSGIGHLAKAINQSQGHKAIHLLEDTLWPDIALETFEAPEAFEKTLSTLLTTHLGPYFKAESPQEALKSLLQFRILCALREGPFGVKGLNAIVEHLLKKKGWIQPQFNLYHGCPIMISQNDYQLQLFNGDIGVIWRNPEGRLRAYFILADGSQKEFIPSRLPHYEKAWAMTVHKSQGSEFQHVLMVLPNQPSPILTRELVYTGITRAKESVTLWSHPKILSGAIRKGITRVSGLPELLKSQ